MIGKVDEERVVELLLHWDDARRRGRIVSAEELCNDTPELAEELARRIAALNQFGRLLDDDIGHFPTEPTTTGIPISRASAECRAYYGQLQAHASGGIGEVFRAVGHDLNREVALKFMKLDRAGDADTRRRFDLEAEITARLEHPGVVPVYGRGVDPSGAPCYAMRFVRGQTLGDAIRAFHAADVRGRDPSERALAYRSLLRRFVSVCNTIGYAHSRGVMHRDIKPGNVMLGKFDETLVVDWGMAKLFDRGDEARAGGEETLTPVDVAPAAPTIGTVGTPRYMSPEQADGRWYEVGPLSDVYSLGATLYELLTGVSAFPAKSVAEVLARVKRGHFLPPRNVKSTVPRPLEAVCLKAMALNPADRYTSAVALAADVERWLAGEPVLAYREPLSMKARRWARRHRTLVTAAVATLLVGLGALAVAYSRESAINKQLRVAKAESDRWFDQTLLAFQGYYTGVSEDVVLGREEFRDLRTRLLESPRQFYEKMTRELDAKGATNERAKYLLIQARHGLGRIYLSLGQIDESKKQYESTVETLSSLIASHPRNLEYQSELVECYNVLGRLQARTGDVASLEQYQKKAVELATTLVAARPDVPNHQRWLAMSHAGLGLARRSRGDKPGAIESFRRADEVLAKLVQSQPEEAHLKLMLLEVRSDLGVVLMSAGDLKGSETAYRLAQEIATELTRSHPENSAYLAGLAVTYNSLGSLHETMKDWPAAEAELLRAIEIRSKLADDRPKAPTYRLDLAISLNDLGEVKRRSGRLSEAIPYYERAHVLMEALAKSEPENQDYQKGLAAILTNLGVVDMAEGRRLKALGRFQEAYMHWKKPFSKNPNDPFFTEGLQDKKAVLDVIQKVASPPSTRSPDVPSK
jgi:serine/threonine-protein kinase